MFLQEIQKLKKEGQHPFFSGLFHFSLRWHPLSMALLHLVGGNVRLVQITSGQVKAMQQIELAEDVLVGNEIRDVEAAAFFVNQFVKKYGGAQEAVAVIPEEELFRRFIQVGAKGDADAVIKKMLPDLLPLPMEEMVWELSEVPPLKAGLNHKDIEILSVSRKYLSSYLDVLTKAGFQPRNFVPESLGILKLLFPSLESPHANLIVFADHHRTLVMVFAGHGLHVTSIIPFGGEELEGSGSTALLEEVKRVTMFYKHRVFHEHGASSTVDKVILMGAVPEEVGNMISFNLQLKPEYFKIDHHAVRADFIPLIGAAKLVLNT